MVGEAFSEGPSYQGVMRPSSLQPLLASDATHWTDLFLPYSFTFPGAAKFESQIPMLKV